jgi:3-phosphoshikimate 1-carboxyvinyltransferase
VTVLDETVSAGEPRGTIVVEGDRTGSVDIAPREVPGLIDELPALAALAAHGGEVHVAGAAELRVTGFRALGIDADEAPDGFTVRGAGSPPGGSADARGDHRLAMAFAIAALAGRSPSRIEGSEAVVISDPGVFDMLHRLVVAGV